MTSRHSAFTIGTSPGAIFADRFAGCGADVAQLARDHRPLFLTGQGLERAFSELLHEVRPERGVRLRIFMDGKRQALRPPIQEQLFLIGREAVVNALRHSKATNIEVEVQYLRCSVRMFVRDNGCGINPDVVQKERDSYSGLHEMRDRADTIGAQFGIWSRPGAGTEVRIAVPSSVAMAGGFGRGPIHILSGI
jgi:signal transduction histidine kinase